MNSRLENDPKHSDMTERMIDTYKKGNLSFPTLWEHASLLTIGGSDTSATLLAGTSKPSYTLRHHKVRKTIRT